MRKADSLLFIVTSARVQVVNWSRFSLLFGVVISLKSNMPCGRPRKAAQSTAQQVQSEETTTRQSTRTKHSTAPQPPSASKRPRQASCTATTSSATDPLDGSVV